MRNGRQIDCFDWPKDTSGDGTPDRMYAKNGLTLEWLTDEWMPCHGEQWIVTKRNGIEISRHNPRFVESIYWTPETEAGYRQQEINTEQLDYSIALQRAIEYHCRGKVVPPEIRDACPHHADMLNSTLEKGT